MATSALESKVNGNDSPGARKKVAFITGITGQVSSPLFLHDDICGKIYPNSF